MIDLDISLHGSEWQDHFPQYESCIKTCFKLVVEHVPECKHFANFSHLELSICLTNDEEIQQINKLHRGMDKPTNVLSFPSLSDEEIQSHLVEGDDIPEYPVALGDIIFALETIMREAEDQKKSLSDHFSHLCFHGMLHLLGYDHIEDDEAEEMEALEKSLLAKLSIDDPYQD